jgi:hypothetical protein
MLPVLLRLISHVDYRRAVAPVVSKQQDRPQPSAAIRRRRSKRTKQLRTTHSMQSRIA